MTARPLSSALACDRNPVLQHAMELTCPHCAARYRVPSDAVAPQGREIHCAKCGESWFQPGATASENADVEAALAHDGPLAEAVPDFGVAEVPAMPIGPAVEMPSPGPLETGPAWDEPRAGHGLGTVGWILLLLVLALIVAGGYAWTTGALKLPA